MYDYNKVRTYKIFFFFFDNLYRQILRDKNLSLLVSIGILIRFLPGQDPVFLNVGSGSAFNKSAALNSFVQCNLYKYISHTRSNIGYLICLGHLIS